jgi:hypothetical protein
MKIKVDKGRKIAMNALGKNVYSKLHDYFKITASNTLVEG